MRKTYFITKGMVDQNISEVRPSPSELKTTPQKETDVPSFGDFLQVEPQYARTKYEMALEKVASVQKSEPIMEEMRITEDALTRVDEGFRTLMNLDTAALDGLSIARPDVGTMPDLVDTLTQGLLIKAGVLPRHLTGHVLGSRNSPHSTPMLVERSTQRYTPGDMQRLEETADVLGLDGPDRETFFKYELHIPPSRWDVNMAGVNPVDRRIVPLEDAVSENLGAMGWDPKKRTWDHTTDTIHLTKGDLSAKVVLPEGKREQPHLAVAVATLRAQEAIAHGGLTVRAPASPGGSVTLRV